MQPHRGGGCLHEAKGAIQLPQDFRTMNPPSPWFLNLTVDMEDPRQQAQVLIYDELCRMTTYCNTHRRNNAYYAEAA